MASAFSRASSSATSPEFPVAACDFDRALVDVGGLDDVRNSCCGQESVPDGAAGGEDQRGSPTPQLHVSKRRLAAPFR